MTDHRVTQAAIEQWIKSPAPSERVTQVAIEDWTTVAYMLPTAGQMDGQAQASFVGSIIKMGAARMDGQAQMAASGSIVSGTAHMDGAASMAAPGRLLSIGAAQMDGLAQVGFDSENMAKGAAQMDGVSRFDGITVDGAGVAYMDGWADVAFVAPVIHIGSLSENIIGGQSTTIRMIYSELLSQNWATSQVLRPKVRYHLVLSNLINWSSTYSFKMKFVKVLKDVAITITPSLAPHSHFHYVETFPIDIGATLTPKFQAVRSLVQNINISQTTLPKFIWGRALTQAINVSASLAPHSTYKALLAQLFKLSELEGFTSRHPIILNQNINLSQLLKGGISLKMLQNLLAGATASLGIRYHLGLTSGVRLADLVDKLFTAILTQLFTVHDAPTHAFTAIGALNQLLTIHPSFTNKLVLKLTGNIQVSHDQLVHMLYQGDPLLDGVIIDALFISPSGTTTAWAVNTRTNAVTEYLNYNFNSYALLNNRYVAAGAEGLYELDGDTDDGALIISDLMGGYLQLNDKKLFGIKGAYVAIRGGGRFYLKLIAGDGREYVYELRAQPNLMTTKVKVGKGISTTYMAWELMTEGQDFDLDSIEFIPMTRGRRV